MSTYWDASREHAIGYALDLQVILLSCGRTLQIICQEVIQHWEGEGCFNLLGNSPEWISCSWPSAALAHMQYRISMSNTSDWWTTLISGLPDFAVHILMVPLRGSSSKGSNKVLHGACMSFLLTRGVWVCTCGPSANCDPPSLNDLSDAPWGCLNFCKEGWLSWAAMTPYIQWAQKVLQWLGVLDWLRQSAC